MQSKTKENQYIRLGVLHKVIHPMAKGGGWYLQYLLSDVDAYQESSDDDKCVVTALMTYTKLHSKHRTFDA